MGAEISQLSAFCKHKLAKGLISNGSFIVLDEYTLRDKSVLLVDNYWTSTPAAKAKTDGILMCRSSFKDAYTVINGLGTMSALMMDEHAVNAAYVIGSGPDQSFEYRAQTSPPLDKDDPAYQEL